MRWMGKKASIKNHFPFLWHPKDLGFEIGPQHRCMMIKSCGISLDKYGYLPCSPAIMITRLFGLTHLYKYELPKGSWGLEEICQHCIFGMPGDWLEKHCYNILTIAEENKHPTERFKKAIENFDYENFYKTQKEF